MGRLRTTTLCCLILGACVESTPRPPPQDATPALDSAALPKNPPASEASRTDGSLRATDAAASAAAPWPKANPPRVVTDWCIDVVSTLDHESCYVLPEKPTRTLLVYLHGVVPPTPESHQKTNFETVVTHASRRAGVAALMPRGRQGLAPKPIASWWGWPTNAGAYRQHTPEMMAKIEAQRRRLEQISGVTFSRLYVAGSSSGAYYAAALALRGGIRADGFGAMSGGSGSATPELAKLPPTPFYIGYGEADTVADSARALAGVLRDAGWPVRIAAHRVGHGAKEVYLDEAFAFWREQQR